MNEKLYLGIDIGGTNTVFAVVNWHGHLYEKREIKTRPERSPSQIMVEIARTCRELISVYPQVSSIGIGIPGIVDAGQGLALYCPNLNWRNVEVSRSLQVQLSLPVFIENDVRCLALAERRFGAARDFNNAICLAIGTGIGAGIFINGQLLKGAFGGAGEVGHMIIVAKGGVRCHCGNTGCWETLVSATAIINLAQQAWERAQTFGLNTCLIPPLDGKQIADAARNGDQISQEVLSEAGKYLGIGLVNLVNLFNPECIVIGGGMAGAGELLLASARKEIMARALPFSAKQVQVVPAELGSDAGVIGAAILGIL